MMLHHLQAAVLAIAVVFGGSLIGWHPYLLTVTWSDGSHQVIPATDQDSCNAAVTALYRGWWRLEGALSEGSAGAARQVVALACTPGDGFAPGEKCIANYNCPGTRR